MRRQFVEFLNGKINALFSLSENRQDKFIAICERLGVSHKVGIEIAVKEWIKRETEKPTQTDLTPIDETF